MPKTTKRAESRRATRVARAHSTELPQLEVKDSKERRRSPGYKAPARGIARYPWAAVIILCLVALGVLVAYLNHFGPFAPQPKPAAKAKATVSAPQAGATLRSGASPCTSASIISKITSHSADLTASDIQKVQHTYSAAPAMSIDTNKLYCAGINTNQGLIVVELDPKIAPLTVNNFVFLAQHQFYDGLVFHRVIQNTAASSGQLHIAQGGDPKGDGSGGPGYKFADEPVKGDYLAGTLAMANSGANTNGSQFFINLTDNKSLPKSYSLFGRVVQGTDVLQKIQGPNESDKNTKVNTTMNHVLIAPAS